MKLRNLARGSAKILPFVLVLAVALPTTGKAKFRVLYNFRDGNDGGKPVLFATLAIDKSGNLFGATRVGGDLKNQLCEGYGCGVIFEASSSGNGRWKEKVLYETTDPLTDGIFSSPLAADGDGNRYGCTDPWGSNAPMFELTPGSAAQWTFNPIWQSGCSGHVGLIIDSAGNLYGEFGNDFNGDIAELSPSSNGWAYTNLYEFCQQKDCPDGDNPLAPFSWDAKGNLYGTTYNGGDPRCYSCGVAFQMTPNGDGTWTYHVLHRFLNGKDGSSPYGSLTVDASGAAYGTTTHGGPYGNGNVFKLTPMKNGRWKLTVLYGFPNGTNGVAQGVNLVFDKAGNLYGIAGTSNCGGTCGLIFKLSPTKSGPWNCTVVHRFNLTDGNFPNGLTMDSQGNLFGTTQVGGKYGYGVVWEITP